MAACEYEAPLTEVHSIPVDPKVLGLWQEVGGQGGPLPQMLIIKYSETEYVIEYPVGHEAMYFRAYPIRIGDVSCVQVRIIGVGTGAQIPDNEKGYQVISYSITEDQLNVKTLNTSLVNPKLDTRGLNEAFLKHQKDQDLFTNPGRFVKVAPPGAAGR